MNSGLLAIALTLLPITAFADSGTGVPVRVGSHDDYGRIVFELASKTDYRIIRQDQRVVIQFSGPAKIGTASKMPRNVLGITGGAGQAELVVASGAVIREWRLADRLVVDVLDHDAAGATSSAAASRPPHSKPSAATPSSTVAAAPLQTETPQAPKKGPPSPAPAQKRSETTGPPPDPVPAVAARSQPTPPQPSRMETPTSPKQGPLSPAPTPKKSESTGRPPDPAAAATAPSQPMPPRPSRTAAPTGLKQGPPSAPAPLKSEAAGPPPAPVAAAVPPSQLTPASQLPPPAQLTPVSLPTPAQPTPAPPSPSAPSQSAPSEPAPAAGGSPASDTTADTAQPADTSPEPASGTDAGLVVAADAQVGAAIFRRGSAALIVFDRPGIVDMAPLRDDPVFGTATVQNLATATVVRVQVDAGSTLSSRRTQRAWQINAIPGQPTFQPIQATVANDRLLLAAATPGNVVSITDPDTGATLLVGTQRRDGQGLPARRRSPEFTLLATWLGVAVEPNADTVVLRPTLQGFLIDGAIALSPPSDLADQLARSVGLTRQFDFPSQPTGALLQSLQRLVTEDATSPPMARGPRRAAVARTMISLGLGAEAQAMLNIAATDDPRESSSPDTAALASIAALLAHRPDEAEGLANPQLPAADDITLWRAVRQAQLQDGSPTAAAMFAATVPLLLAYPPPIRDRILPLAVETLVRGGEFAAAASVLDARKNDAALDLARAMLQEAQGDTASALAGYDRLAQSRDQSVHARAAERAVELRLSTGAINAKQAAEKLEGLLYSWRGDGHERALRERLVELKCGMGEWRSALALLREGETLFPEDKAAIQTELTDKFAALLRGKTADTLAPLELVSVVEENADLLPAGADGDALQAKLADRLLALDLPKRAGPILEKLMLAAPSGAGRAGFGARLAALRLREGDAAGALAALEASIAADLPAELAERRTLLVAEANARRGDNARALAALDTLDSAPAAEARATIAERTNDWPAAQRALADYVVKTVPAEGKLDEAQRRTLLRLATAMARTSDTAALVALRQREGPRMETGPLADMFRLLTADQVRGVADLKRSGQEAVLAHALPDQLRALQPQSGQTGK